ncbi:hypothetical protein DRJ16_04510 [Candidatus Woesearchaeota archaeon]|nr:MAG: hypothetical protein DRJ16_04510 [Candidatus Woesearchaeota archaeon]HDM43691.1 hypothetical protein [Candidatus Woesearchaeota archaeon]
MRRSTVKKLLGKGWSKEEISETAEALRKMRFSDKSKTLVYGQAVLFWMGFFVILIGNLLIGIVLVPFLFVMNRLIFDLIILILGFCFGMLTCVVFRDLEHLEKKHRMFLLFVVPVIALVNLLFVYLVAKRLNELFAIGALRENPFIMISLYVASFLAPYVYWLVFRKGR